MEVLFSLDPTNEAVGLWNKQAGGSLRTCRGLIFPSPIFPLSHPWNPHSPYLFPASFCPSHPPVNLALCVPPFFIFPPSLPLVFSTQENYHPFVWCQPGGWPNCVKGIPSKGLVEDTSFSSVSSYHIIMSFLPPGNSIIHIFPCFLLSYTFPCFLLSFPTNKQPTSISHLFCLYSTSLHS